MRAPPAPLKSLEEMGYQPEGEVTASRSRTFSIASRRVSDACMSSDLLCLFLLLSCVVLCVTLLSLFV